MRHCMMVNVSWGGKRLSVRESEKRREVIRTPKDLISMYPSEWCLTVCPDSVCQTNPSRILCDTTSVSPNHTRLTFITLPARVLESTRWMSIVRTAPRNASHCRLNYIRSCNLTLLRWEGRSCKNGQSSHLLMAVVRGGSRLSQRTAIVESTRSAMSRLRWLG